MTLHDNSSRWTAAGLALTAALTFGACSDRSKDDVTNDPVDNSSTTPPEEGDKSTEETQNEMDQN